MSIYKELAQQFIGQIQSGKLTENARMPSLRKLSKQHCVSVSTAVSCYQELESQGWIHARPQSGYFVSSKRNAHTPPKWAHFESHISEPSTRVSVQSKLNGPLGVSSSDIDDKAAIELQRSFHRAMRRMNTHQNVYPDYMGELSLRQVLSCNFAQLGHHFHPNDLVITSGCISSIKTALEVCSEAGDAIAISSPCFSGILELLARMSRKIIEIPSLNDGIDLDQLEQHFRDGNVRAGIFCTSHMNPQGITMSAQQKQRLAKLANHYKVPVIEDDVYLELDYSGQCPLPAKSYDSNGYILWCGSVSKSLSPTYRLGWCLPGRYIEDYSKTFASGCFGVSAPVQLALSDFIESGQYVKHLKRKRLELLDNRRDYLAYLAKNLPESAQISTPEGGLVLWLQIPELDGIKLAEEAKDHQLDIREGQLFSTLDLYKNCLRINIGHPLIGQAEHDLKLLCDLIYKHLIIK